MVTLPLYDEVILDYTKIHKFRRQTVTINNIGREERASVDFDAVAMVRPISTYDLTSTDKEGTRYEDQVKVHFTNDGSVDIQLNDLVFFGGFWYKLDRTRGIEVSDFTMMVGQMVKDRNA